MNALMSQIEAGAGALRMARRAYAAFQGLQSPDRELDIRGPARMPGTVWQLGTLWDLELEDGRYSRPLERAAWVLAANPEGTELYLCSRRPIRPFRPGAPGRIAAISYRTDKGEGRAIYRHEFEGDLPVLRADADGWPVIDRGASSYAIEWRGIVR